METKTKRIDYKALCYAPFDMDSEYEVNFKMLVYTGKKEEERPVFRVVIAKDACKVVIGTPGKELWGVTGFAGELGSIGPAAEETLRLDGTAGSGVGL